MIIKNISKRPFNFSYGSFPQDREREVSEKIGKLTIKSYPDDFKEIVKDIPIIEKETKKTGGKKKCPK